MIELVWAGIALICFFSLAVALIIHLSVNIIAPRVTSSLEKLKKYMFRKTMDARSLAILGKHAETTLTQVEMQMVQFYNETSNDPMYNKYVLDETVGLEYFITKLRTKNYLVQIVNEFCTQESCKVVLKCTSEKGNILWLGTTSHAEETRDHQGRERYKSDWVRGESILVGYNLSLIYASSLGKDHEDVQTVLNCAQQAIAERIYYETPREVNTSFYTLSKNLSLAIITRKARLLSSKELDAQYADFNLALDGQTYKCTPTNTVNFCLEAVRTGINLFLYGKPGTGKSTLNEHIAVCLMRMYDGVVVSLSAAQIQHIVDSGTTTEFIEAMTQLNQDASDPLLITIDEAETLMTSSDDNTHTATSTFLLELLDGNIKQSIGENVSIILIFNQDPKNLNARLFRPGRGMLLTIDELDRQQGDKLVKSMQTNNPDFVFEQKKYESLWKNEKTSMSDIIYCFQKPGPYIALKAAIEGKTIAAPTVRSTPLPKIKVDGEPVATKPSDLKEVLTAPKPVVLSAKPAVVVEPAKPKNSAQVARPKHRNKHKNRKK